MTVYLGLNEIHRAEIAGRPTARLADPKLIDLPNHALDRGR